IGIVFPFFLGWGVTAYFLPNESTLAHVFAGATLTATSVGITVRVLTDLQVMQRMESKIILGAAVIDDILGLLVLASVSSLIAAHNSHTTMDLTGSSKILGSAVIFLVLVVGLGRVVIPYFFKYVSHLMAKEMLLAASLLICFGFAYLADVFGLAPIVGAFAAGLILEAKGYAPLLERSKYESIIHLVHPITALLLPIFFVSMGAKVDVSVFGNSSILGLALCLTAVAIIGKQACGLGIINKGVDRIAVGLGMIPRGEVGLIFIGIGSTMLIDGVPVVDPATFGSVIIVVVVTTMITPSLVKWRFSKL
ncbi:MAG: cation:proton antiporter, partial [Deltaproteobacteria bacterium]|nr:cation:proton antiporter [Deltaproteobacteria bacterium]